MNWQFMLLESIFYLIIQFFNRLISVITIRYGVFKIVGLARYINDRFCLIFNFVILIVPES